MLAPLAFIIYINDLLQEFDDQHTVSVGYADHTCFLLNFSSEHVLGSTIMRIQKWSNSNGLLLNAKKCCFMVLGNQCEKYSTPVKIHSGDNHDVACTCPTVTRVTQAKYLGVFLDDEMAWKVHVDSLIKKNFVPW